MIRHIMFFLYLWKGGCAVIYNMNETEYNRMPPLYELDEYASCLLEPGGTYCVVDVQLFSETNSELMRIIQGYSEHTMKHFNHTQIHRGVCVTNKCKHIQRYYDKNETLDLNATLEACLNESTWINYGIQGTLAKVQYCKKENEREYMDLSDVIVAVVYIALVVLNVVGSLYDVMKFEKDDKTGNPYLLAFSLRRNWSKLVASNSTGREPRLDRLKLFHGMRTMTMVCVFFSHTVLIMAYSYVDNPIYIEKAYQDPLKHILFNGSLVTHTFFVMSSFLMAYNFQLYSEKHKISWVQWPKGILLRWIRLTPTYALVLATLSTWMRYAGSGPLWDLVVTSEAQACRQYWWAHVLYVNNYIYDDAFCAPQTWYLAADTQLFCVGLLVCIAARGSRAKVAALLVLMLVSLVIPAAHTYFQELDAVVIQAPETYRSLYAHEDTFRLLYIRGHTNLSTYTLGLAGGFLTYHWQTRGKDFKRFKNYRWAFWWVFPLGVAVILSGGLFYIDGWRPSTALRVLYATFYKPVFQLLVVIIIMGCIFKLETVYRGIVEWRGFAWTGRVSYSAFLLHTVFQRALVGSYPVPMHMSDYYVVIFLSSTIFVTFMCAGALWLCVEAPAAAALRALLEPRAGGTGRGRGRGRDAGEGHGDGDGDGEGSKV